MSDIELNLNRLRKKGNKEHALGEQNYLKTPFKCYGVYSKDLMEEVNAFHKANCQISKKELQKILDRLWNSNWHTEKTFAVKLASLYVKDGLFICRDIDYFEKWINQCTGWDHTDEICAHIVGELLLEYPDIKKNINSWTKSKHMWTRRASLISYIISVRKSKSNLSDIFNNIKKLSQEKDFFIRKAIGWILREAGKKAPKDVKRFVKENEDKLSNLSKREALRKIT